MVTNKAEELEGPQCLVPEVVQAEVMSFPGSFLCLSQSQQVVVSKNTNLCLLSMIEEGVGTHGIRIGAI